MAGNTLTPQLSQTQLQQNIDALQKGGMATSDVQSYVNNYKSDGQGGYVLANAQAAPANTTPAVKAADPNVISAGGAPIVGGAAGGAIKSIAADTNVHAANIAQDLSDKPSFTGALDVTGNVAGEAGDIVGEGLKAITPQPIKDALSGAAKSVAGSPAAKAMLASWNAFQAQHPDAAKDIGNAVNIGSLFGADAAEPVVTDAAATAKDAIGDTAKSLADNADGQAKIVADEGVKTATDKASQATWETIKPTLTPTEQAQAVQDGKIQSKGVLGTITQVPKGRDLDMIKAATPYVANAKSPIEAVANMQQGIADEATQLRAGLDNTGAIYSKSQVAGALSKIETPTLITSDATLNKAYGLVKDKMLSLVGNGGKLGDLLEARKNFDAFVSKQFPNLYNSDTLTPMRSAIKDIRGSINDVIESRLPNGKTPDGLNFRDSLKKQSLLYDAIDNTASKVGKVGSNKVTQLIKAHPLATKIAATAAGTGVAAGAAKSLLNL